MKHTRTVLNTLVAGVGLLALVGSVAAQDAEGMATVVRVKGPARYSTGNNVWQPLRAGTILRPGAIVQTGTAAGSYVDLVLGQANVSIVQPAVFHPFIPNSMAASGYQPAAAQNVVRLWQNTALGIDKLASTQTGAETVTDTQLDLKMGRITGNVKKMSAASKYEIKLPNGVAGIRGTFYDIYAEGIVKVRIGSVVLAWVDPKTGNVVTQVVNGGQAYDARTGQVTPLAPGDLQELSLLSAQMIFVQAVPQTTIVSDLTVTEVSPIGTPANPPPAPPPNIPTGR
jgi:FecR protein